MSKLYVPNDVSLDNVSCIFLENNDSIIIRYSDNTYYKVTYNNLLSDYNVSQTYFDNFDVSCSNIELTHDYFYRKDIDSIIILFFILSIICLYFPYRIFSRLFGRWLKL